MAAASDNALDRLWEEYSLVFQGLDDNTLARWMSQTLTQLQGRTWRLSHPLLGAYRLASQLGHERQVWLKRLVSVPGNYQASECCRAPLLPLFTRDLLETGLLCQHCSGTAVPFEEIPQPFQQSLKVWLDQYCPIHAIAHREESKAPASESELKQASAKATDLMQQLASNILPKGLEYYPALVWEDQDECLLIRPEDIQL